MNLNSSELHFLNGNDSSVLNQNARFSQIDISLNLSETREDALNPLGARLSITLDESERELLQRQPHREVNSHSVMASIGHLSSNSISKNCASLISTNAHSVTLQANLSSSQQTKVNITNGISQLEISKTLDVTNDLDDDSVIPIEDDAEDEAEESTMQSMQASAIDQSIEKHMFSHLQQSTPATLRQSAKIDGDVTTNEEFQKSDTKHDVCTNNAGEDTQASEAMDTSAVEDVCSETKAAEHQTNLKEDESTYFQTNMVELGRRLWPSSAEQQCYTKGCLWSPDGTCLLVPVHMDGMHVIELPLDLYTTNELDEERELSKLNSAVHVKEGGMVYDVAWYPFMNSSDAATCCWLATRQHEPMHMWDAFTGELRCSYRGYDDVDEVESAISIAFINDGQKIAGGYKKSIKIFDTNIPGRDYTSIRVKQSVSCFAFNEDNENCVTSGSWNNFIYHYDLRAPQIGPLFVLSGHKGGVTWLKYSSYNTDNWHLFSGSRMDNNILQWDMRNYKEPVKAFERNVETNQRIYFDLSPTQRWLISGDTKGYLRVWDMDEKRDSLKIPIHEDCCNGVSFHPNLPIIASSSGQYHFLNNDEDAEELEAPAADITIQYENSVVLTWFGGLHTKQSFT